MAGVPVRSLACLHDLPIPADAATACGALGLAFLAALWVRHDRDATESAAEPRLQPLRTRHALGNVEDIARCARLPGDGGAVSRCHDTNDTPLRYSPQPKCAKIMAWTNTKPPSRPPGARSATPRRTGRITSLPSSLP